MPRSISISTRDWTLFYWAYGCFIDPDFLRIHSIFPFFPFPSVFWFFVFFFFFLTISTASLFFDQRSNLDRFFFLVSRNRVSFFSQTFLLSFSFFFGGGGERVLTILCPRGEYFEHAEKAGFDKGYDWLILSFDVRVRPETTIKIQGGIESLGASFDASSKSRPLDSFQRAR